MKKDDEEKYKILVGEAIRELRKENYPDKNIYMFAKDSEIPRATLSRIETGQNEARLLSLKRLAGAFGWNLSTLFAKIEEKLPEDLLVDETKD